MFIGSVSGKQKLQINYYFGGLWKNRTVAITLLWFCFLQPAVAVDLSIDVMFADGRPLTGAAVEIHRSGSENFIANESTPNSSQHVMDQINKRFVPNTLLIKPGDTVRFPNSDNIRHHVYSFSKPKPFELPLYAQEPTEPLLFNNTGVVVVGCNIHDRMQGRIFISDAEWALELDNGRATLSDIPPGSYKINILHPTANPASPDSLDVVVAHQQTENITILVEDRANQASPRTLTEVEKKFLKLRNAQP